MRDYDTQEQCDAFEEYLKEFPHGRVQHPANGAYGYKEEEWDAFQSGWNAAKKHFLVVEVIKDQCYTPSEYVCRQRSVALVIAMVGEELSANWWGSPNKAFDMQTPFELWDEDYRRVYEYLMRMSCGEW